MSKKKLTPEEIKKIKDLKKKKEKMVEDRKVINK